MRDIARKSDVAPSLLFQYFGSKLDLFEAALIAAVTHSNVLEGDRATLGVRFADLTVANADADMSLTTMMVLSIGDPDAAAVTARVTKEHIVDRLAEWLGPPDAEARAMNFIMIATGFAVYNQRIPVTPLQPATLQWFAAALQAIVDQR